MNKNDSIPSFEAPIVFCGLDECPAGEITGRASHLDQGTIALYREIYRRKLTQREPRFWDRLLEWTRKATRKDQFPATLKAA